MSSETIQTPAPKKARVKDVASAAGVSVATVSRAFNIPGAVRDDVRQKVLEVAKRMGYSPNAAAKALRLQRTRIVGAVFPTTDQGLYARMVERFQRRMAEEGYMTFLLTAGYNNKRLYAAVQPLVERGAEALLMVGRVDDERLAEYLQEVGIPVVCTYSALDEGPFASIGVDNYDATSQVMEYLYQLGHREFAMLAGPLEGNDRQQARVKAFQDALARHGLKGGSRVYEDPRGYPLEFGMRAFQRIRSETPKVTAIVCNSDAYGMAVLAEARRLGVSVPGDVSVTGFDDLAFAALLDPPLTTVSVAADEMGVMAADALVDALDKGMQLMSHRLQPRLIVRGSTSVPPAAARQRG